MNRKLVLLLAALASVGCQHSRGGARPEAAAPSPDPLTERTIAQGKIIGISDVADTHAWLGIPFAEPPVGPRRWRAPLPPSPWTDVRQAVRFGSRCVQFGNALSAESDKKLGEVVGSEDCLTLNVWAPRFEPGSVPTDAQRLPVMFWIHGGGNSMGSGSDYAMARNLAARHGVIVVTVNYRLGVLGWFHHPALHGADSSPEDRSGNYGTLDLIRGLEWVKENIATFGGDPGNVTIFGESAGGMNVYSLLVSPKAKGLFHRAIAQSGFPSSTPLPAARNLVDDAEPGIPGSSNEVLVHLLVADGLSKDRTEAKARLAGMSAEETARYLHQKTPQELLSMFKGSTFGMYRSPDILRDGTVLPLEPFLQVMGDPARYNAVPAILGTNRDEAKLFMAANPRFVGKWLGLIPRIRDVEEYNRSATYMSDTWKVLGADLPATRMRSAQGPNVFVYRFEWDELPSRWPVDLGVLMGAAHAFELPFVFHDLDTKLFGIATEENRPGREALSKAMSSYWAEFARTGSPGRGRAGELPEWKPWEDSSPSVDRLMIFDSPAGGGVRMSSLRMTPEELTERVMKDAAFEGKPQERCLQFARMFNFVRATGHWGAEEFQSRTGGACKDLTPEQIRAAQMF